MLRPSMSDEPFAGRVGDDHWRTRCRPSTPRT